MSNKLSPHGKTIVEGSVSWGTLRTQDILRSFAREVEGIKPFGEHGLINDARQYADMLDETNDPSENLIEEAHDVLLELTEVLESAAPDGMYFGTAEGDGSDFGFWPTGEQDDD